MISALFSQTHLFSQTVILQEDFNSYDASALTMPAGWLFSYHGAYTTSALSGASGPNAYQFGANKATINTPAFSNADTLKFWIKGSSTDTISKLIILESADSISWDTLSVTCPLPTKAINGKRKFSIKHSSAHLRFTYIKSKGNLAFDDFSLSGGAVAASFSTDINNGCIPVCSNFRDLSITSQDTISNWSWDFGDGNYSTLKNPGHCYANPGTYSVKLIVGNGTSSDTLLKTNFVNAYSFPVAFFAALTSASDPTVTFTDQSVDAVSWNWDFGDGQSSVVQDPGHTYGDSGTYCPVLYVSSAHGCADTVQECIKINALTTGVVMPSVESQFSVFPNPSEDGTFKISCTTSGERIISVYNVTGGIVQTIKTNEQSETIKLTGIQPGIYFVRISGIKLSAVQKIIVSGF